MYMFNGYGKHNIIYTHTHTHVHTYTHIHIHTRAYMHTCMQTYMQTYTRIHTYTHNNGWRLGFEDTRLLGKLAISVCKHLLRHSCIVFTQHTHSQFVVYTVIIAEQTVITISENECIYQCGQRLNKTGTPNPSVTIICDIVLAQPPMGFRKGFHLPNFPHMA